MKYLLAAALLALPLSCSHAQSAFAPGGNTVSLAATATTGRVQFQTSADNPNVRLYNAGTVAVHIQCGDVAVTATTAAGMPVAPGVIEVIACRQQYVAGITASGTATLYVTPGSGL